MAEPIETPEAPKTELSQQERLADLTAQATALYAVKDYIPAAEVYADAAELQAEINGEMSIDNADLLYSYGKCLYFVAVKTSDVLGSEAAGGKLGGKNTASKKTGKKRKANGEPSDAAIILNGSKSEQEAGTLPELVEGGAKDVIPESDLKAPKEKTVNKPFFSFEGDEDIDSDSDGDADGEGEEAEEDDFANAFEVLDLSRILLLRKLDQLQSSTSSSPDTDPLIRQTKERLADIHDLQAEISLEGERFSAAVTDLQSSLTLKQSLYPLESSLLAECHYKLSLALEFSSVTQQHDPQGNPTGEASYDQKMRDQAAEHMESAIASCTARISKEEAELETITDTHVKAKAEANIADVKEMVADMQQRLRELRRPPVDIKAESAAGLVDKEGIMAKILGGGETIEEVSKKANDLSGMVKRKPKNVTKAEEDSTPEPSTTTGVNGNGEGKGKRKVAFVEEDAMEMETGRGKKVKLEDVKDAD